MLVACLIKKLKVEYTFMQGTLDPLDTVFLAVSFAWKSLCEIGTMSILPCPTTLEVEIVSVHCMVVWK